MRSRFRSLSLALCAFLTAAVTFPGRVSGAPLSWNNVGPGVEFQQYSLPGPIEAYVARMDRANPQTTIESAIANNQLSSGGEYVSNMARRMNDSLSLWEPSAGARSQVVVAINGSGYWANAEPKSGMLVSGWYAKRFDDNGGGSGFGWRTDRAAFIGKCVSTNPDQQFVSFPESGAAVSINAVNIPREPNQLVLYTPQYGTHTRTSPDGVELVIELLQPMRLQMTPGVRGIVRDIRDGEGGTPIPFDGLVLSAVGSARDSLLAGAQLNAVVEINQRITHYDWNCRDENTFSWANTYTSMHGDYAVLRDGEVFPKSDDAGATIRNPRTAIAFNDSHIFFIVVDGRSLGHSIGMNFEELALFARDMLGATWAIAQDGGGSSVMVINGQVVNYPVSKCPAGVTLAPQAGQGVQPQQVPPLAYLPLVWKGQAGVEGDLYACERPVANAMMMVALQPGQRSATYQDFDQVSAAAPVEVRTGPGTNFGMLGTAQAGTAGVVIPHSGGLNGVLAKGSYWWKVDLNGTVGWASEPFLGYIGTPPHGLVSEMQLLDIESP